MARYLSQNLTTRRNTAAALAAALLAAVIAALQYLLVRGRALMDDVRDRELAPLSRQSGALPRGLFDPLFSGLSADAAVIDAALSRRAEMR
jgi:hypothetical protein